MGGLWSKLKSLFTRHIELVIVGLDSSGKTTFLNQLCVGEPLATAPTLGLNVRNVRKGHVVMKAWDLGGSCKYRLEWPRYARGTNAIIFMVDSSAPQRLSQAKKELHMFLETPELYGIPLLVISNKSDLQGHLTETQVIRGLNLDYVSYNPWAVIQMSALKGDQIEQAVDWILKQSRD